MAANEVSTASLLWPFRANWREAVNTSFAFQTTIFKSTSGKEQRRALRIEPRAEIDFLTSALDAAAQHQLDRFIGENQNREMVMPDYSRVRRAEVTSNTTIDLVGGARWAVPGGLVVIRSETTTELRRIAALLENDVLVTTTPFAAVGPVQVYPGLYGLLEASLAATMVTAAVKEVRVDFAALPGLQIPVYRGEVGEVFDGREVFLEKADWKARSHDFTRERTQLDYEVGRVRTFTPVAFGTRTYAAKFVTSSRGDLERIVGFFFRKFGRLKEFFAPTWADDLTVVAEAGPSLTVRANGSTTLDDNTVDRALMILRDDGSRSYHRVTGLALAGDNQALTVTPNIPVATSGIVLVCWMPLCRFATDQLSISHRTAEVATFDFSIQTLQYRAASA